jgi:hypothetical protein
MNASSERTARACPPTRALNFGRPFNQTPDPELESEVQRLHALGRADYQIAVELRIAEKRARRIRRELGLAPHRSTLANLGKMRESNTGRRFWLNYRVAIDRFAAESGWPGGLPLRAVTILNALAALGPLTTRQVATVIGVPASPSDGKLHFQGGNRRSCFKTLEDAGLIFRVQTGHRREFVWLLTAKAGALQMAKGAQS